MGDPSMRKSAALCRLRNHLRKKRESLADQFEFKMFILFHFKEKKKKCAVFEVAEVLPVMTNNYEESILKGAKNENYSMESSMELLEKDVVQFHAPRWQSLRRDVIGCTCDVDFFLWPRKDIDKIQCMLFSRWKGDTGSYRQILTDYVFFHQDYEKPLMCLLSRKERNNMIINNPDQSMFLFIDRLQLETCTTDKDPIQPAHHGSLTRVFIVLYEETASMNITNASSEDSDQTVMRTCRKTAKNAVTIMKLSSICLYLPQDQLTRWTTATVETIINPLLP